MAPVAELSGRHALKVWSVADLGDDELEPMAEVDFGTTIPMNFVFGPNGDDLDGSTYFTGVANVGFQMDFQLTLLFNLNLTFSVGYAVAFEEGFGPRDQVMVSLNLYPAR